MSLDADTVLWALQALHDPQGRGVLADEVARLLSKDATLSRDYSADDVADILDALVADGQLVRATDRDGDESGTGVAYQLPIGSDPQWLPMVNGADAVGVVPNLPAGSTTVRIDGTVVAPTREQQAVEALQARVHELRSDHDAVIEDRDAWRRHAEALAHDVAELQREKESLDARVRDLENVVDDAPDPAPPLERTGLHYVRARALARTTPRFRKQTRGNWLDQLDT